MYHLVSDDISRTRIPKLRVRVDRFRAQMAYLASRGFHPITCEDWLAWKNGEKLLPEKPVIISFDDGFRNFFSIAQPILKQHGFCAVVFLVTGYIGKTNVWDKEKGEPEEELLTEDEIKKLADEGIEFGAHSHLHQDLTTLSSDQVEKDAFQSKKILEDILKRPARVFSYPFGRTSLKAEKAIKAIGFELGFTIQPGGNDKSTDSFRMRRIIVKRSDTMLDFMIKIKKGKSRI